jgi:DNA-binding Lrp family transcriptional regulator
MKFSQRDLHIISAYQGLVEEPIAKITQKTGVKEHIVRRVITQASDAGLLTRHVHINPFSLGLQQYALLIAGGATSRTQRNRLREALLKAPYVELLLELGGVYSFGLVLTVRSVFNLEVFFGLIGAKGGVSIKSVQFHQRTGWHYFGAKYLSSRFTAEPIHQVASGAAPPDLSADDVKVIQAFASSPDGNRSQLSRNLGMPAATVQYKLERLIRLGVIAGVRCQIVPAIVGYQPFRALIRTKVMLDSNRKAIIAWAERHPLVVSLMHGVGGWQHELRIEAPNFAAASEACEELAEVCGDYIEQVEVLPVAKVLKMKLAPDSALQGIVRT